MEVLRSPTVLVGLLLTLIGFGNVYTGYSKSVEYERLLASRTRSQQEEGRAERARGTHSSLLSTFERGQIPSTAARSKLDFYRVVHTGGRFLTLVGVFCIVGGVVLTWQRRARSTRVDAARGTWAGD